MTDTLAKALEEHEARKRELDHLNSELFDTKIRFSGISIGYAISSVIGSLTPNVLTWLVAKNLGVWAMSGFMFLGAFISFIAVLLMWETYKVDLKAKLNT